MSTGRRPRSLPNDEKENVVPTQSTRVKRSGFPSEGYLTPEGLEEESEIEPSMIPEETGLRVRRRPAIPLGDLRTRRVGLGDDFEVLRDASSRHNGKRQVDGKASHLDLRGHHRAPKHIVEEATGDEGADEEELESEQLTEHFDEASHTSTDEDFEELEQEDEDLEELQEDDDNLGDFHEYNDEDTEEQAEDNGIGMNPRPDETEIGLRATSAQLLEGWRREKAAIIQSSNGAVVADPSANPPFRRWRSPPMRFRVRRLFGRPANKLFRHLGLINDAGRPVGTGARTIYRWLRREDSILLDQVALVAPRLRYTVVKNVYESAFQTVRPRVLEYLRENHSEATWCLFFSEFVYFNPRHEGASGVCLFLMVSDENVQGIKRAVERLVNHVQRGDEMAVIVRRGDPRLFGSYGLSREDDDQEYEAENQTASNDAAATPEESTRGFGFLSNLFNRPSTTPVKEPPTSLTAAANSKNAKGKGKANQVHPWSPSPTPPPGSPVQNVLKLHYDARGYTTWQELEPFHYGLRWVTKLAVPASEEGVNASFEVRPSIGSSLGNVKDSGSGTLAGYLHDGKGNCYAMSCHHVMKLDADSVWPTPSDYLKGRTAVAPAQQDLYVATKVHGHEIDGLVHEAVGAHLRGDTELACQIYERGRKKVANHDVHVKLLERGGARFGKIVASAWRIAHTKEGPWLMDQVVVKPFDARIGTNAFTYTGRDNKEGKRYRLEARGWADLPLGAEVLKVGRTTGLTKGFVVATDADIRLCVGTERMTDPNRMTKRFWELKTGIITSGSGPWFSEPGDSGAWILGSPPFEDMLSWDLRRRYSRAAADPIAAPVGGMMFGGADSVDGVSLTFYNPAKLLRRYLAKMMEGGENLVPGVGEPLAEPALLEEAWNAEEEWSRQSREAREGFETFAERNFLAHHLHRFGDMHIFREPESEEEYDEEVAEATSKAPKTHLKTTKRATTERVQKQVKEETGFKSGRTRQSVRDVEVRVPRTPYRRGTSEEAPDTPTPKNNGALSSREPQRRPAAPTTTPMHSPTKPRTPRTAPARAPSTLQTPRTRPVTTSSKIPAPSTQPARVPSTLRTPLRRPQSTLLSSGAKARRPPPANVQDADSDDEVELA
ncbi:hypothetical protein TWF696_006954 [Orbilia brochopaga]|uniref:Uncharacterized protein n=1 Tax=Orbilia brochopaga TaxID=3140254 RepID=A0AAV9UU19_9PEZI